mmetsp:Transcript_120023/g.218194  ORF Transcript_120023/g.218194 Transcript_120023/m.218194 type:complete len:290 (+) Transcript_120023:96-965(+)
MSVAKFALIAVCCNVASLASVVNEESSDCAAFPQEEVPSGEHVMLQHSEAHRVGINAVEGKAEGKKAPTCTCQTANPEWKPCKRTTPKCVFIDLGAADGNTFNVFMNNGYTNLANCTAGGADAWEAILVEANPKFVQPLTAEAVKYPGKVAALHSTAAYMCEGWTSFFLDTVNADQNNWGSSMSSDHPDVQKSGGQNVTVPTMNLNRILVEHTIPADHVIVKMDIEGAEFDTLPCLALSPSASLVDTLFLETHQADWGNVGTTVEGMEVAKALLQAKGVEIPAYESPTL